MKRILWINPTTRDRREMHNLHALREWTCIYHYVGDYAASFDLTDTYTPLIQEIENISSICKRLHIDGVVSTDDYPGQMISCLVAHELGLRGPEPHTFLPLQDKYYMRKLEKRCVPEATPEFETISCEDPHLTHVSFPCIVKPMKGAGSLGTLYIHSQQQLDLLYEIPDLYMQPLHDVLAHYTDYKMPYHALLVENFARGEQVTVDGFVDDNDVYMLGVVDCHLDPYTLRFERFRYPSRLALSVQRRLYEIVTRLVQAAELRNTFFSVECRYDCQTDEITIIEMNTRMSSQFADMYEKVDGFHPYQIAVDIACGDVPRVTHRSGSYRYAMGFCIHTDADYFVESVPTPEEKQAIMYDIPDIRIEVDVKPGLRMSSCDNAVFVYGYAMLNIGGDNDQEIEDAFYEASSRLNFTFSP